MNFLQPQVRGYGISLSFARDSGLSPGEGTLLSQVTQMNFIQPIFDGTVRKPLIIRNWRGMLVWSAET